MPRVEKRASRPPARLSTALLAGALLVSAGLVGAARVDQRDAERDMVARADTHALDQMSKRAAQALHLAIAIEDEALATETIEKLRQSDPQIDGVRARFASGQTVSVGEFDPTAARRSIMVGTAEAGGDALLLGAEAPPTPAVAQGSGEVEIAAGDPSGSRAREPLAPFWLPWASALSIVSVLGMALWLRRRLRRLAEAAGSLSAGDFEAPKSMVARDEVGWAAQALADLGGVLAEQVDRVHGRNAALLRDVTLKEDRLQRLASFASQLVAPLGEGATAQAALQVLCAEADADIGVLMVPPAEGTTGPSCAAAVGLPFDHDDPNILEGLPYQGPVDPSELEAGAFDLPELAPGHTWMDRRQIPLQGVARIQLQFRGRSEGTVVLARRLRWTEPERDFVRDAARPLAIALANRSAYQATVALAQALEERNDTLARQRDELAVVHRLRGQFVANMSHELRTPLNAIIGYSELLADGCYGDVTELQRTQLESVLEASNNLLTLVNQVLDLSRADAGALDIEAERCDLLDLAGEVTRLASPLCRERPYNPGVEGDHVAVMTDRNRVQQILTNLVGNAIKFTQTGSVVVHVLAGVDGGARIEVRDTGCGIDPAHAEIIFEEFRQADGSSTRAHDGVGLGLAISRRLADALGGRLEVQSRAGRGSSFTLTLPAKAPAQNSLDPTAEPQGRQAC